MKILHILILVFLISFGTVACVAFTPTLPAIVQSFGIPKRTAELTVIVFLAGYAIGQLLYGPVANRFGSRNAIRVAALFTILASIGCIASDITHSFNLLLAARFVLALGAGGGLTLAILITNKYFGPKDSPRILSLITMGFSIPPAIAVFICSYLLLFFDWSSAFSFMFAYGIFIFALSFLFPEVIVKKNLDALNPKTLWESYKKQLTKQVVFGGLLIGIMTSFVFIFSDLSPFIAMQIMDTNPKLYGVYNFLPMLGMVIGALLANASGKHLTPKKMIHIGLFILTAGVIILMITLTKAQHDDFSLFLPMIIIYIGFSFIYGNAVARALAGIEDKSNATSIVNFINMSSATCIVLVLKSFSVKSALILPSVYGTLIFVAIFWHFLTVRYEKKL